LGKGESGKLANRLPSGLMARFFAG